MSFRRSSSIWIGTAAFILFLYAGIFKGLPVFEDLPFDLTLFFALVSVVFGVGVVVSNFRVPKALLWVVLLHFSLALPLFWTEWTAYAEMKVTRMFTVTLLAMVFPMIWFDDRRKVRVFFDVLAVLGAAVCVGGLFQFITDPTQFSLSVFSGDRIVSGRLAGILALWLSIRGIHSEGLSGLLWFAVVPIPTAMMLATGGRGPMLAFATAMIVLWLVAYAPKRRKRVKTVAVAAVVIGAAITVFPYLPLGASARLAASARGEWGLSVEVRVDSFRNGFASMAAHPEGLGWGGYERIVPGVTYVGRPDEPVRQYPHNIMIESFVEGGWIVGLILTALLAVAVTRAARTSKTSDSPEADALFGILVFLLMGAMFSNEWNDNRDLLALVSLALVFPGQVTFGNGMSPEQDGEQL